MSGQLDLFRNALPDPRADTIGKHHGPDTGAPETERAAAILTMPRTGTARIKVLAAIAGASDGYTDDELQVALAMNPSTQRPRRVELVEQGWIEDSGRRRKTRGGSQAVVWVLTEPGKRQAFA